jgi:ABC-type bacteriocin/lantibiotic exporter with double-glycine peptidase domain
VTLRWLCLLAAAGLLGGCAAASVPEPAAALQFVPGVPPFTEQTRGDDCAGVALASLLGHAGVAVPAADIDAAVYDPRLGGSLLPDLENFATGAGTRPRSGRGSIAELHTLLDTGYPVLIPLDLGWGRWRRPHYVVLYGFGDDRFLMHVREGESRVISAAELDRRWAGMGRLYLYLER